MYGFGSEEEAIRAVRGLSTVVNGEVYLPISIIEAVNEGFAMIILSAGQDADKIPGGWADGALDVMGIYKKITDGLLNEYAEELVPDTIPDNLLSEE